MEDVHLTAGLWIKERHLLDHLSVGRDVLLSALAAGRLCVRRCGDVSLVNAVDIDALLRAAASPLAAHIEDDRFREDAVQRHFQRANHPAHGWPRFERRSQGWGAARLPTSVQSLPPALSL